MNRGDKRTRRVRDRDFVKFERSRRYRDRWCLPGTLVRQGESLEESAYRILSEKELTDSEIPGYSWRETISNYGGIEQRWLLVESQARQLNPDSEEIKTLNAVAALMGGNLVKAWQLFCHRPLPSSWTKRAWSSSTSYCWCFLLRANTLSNLGRFVFLVRHKLTLSTKNSPVNYLLPIVKKYFSVLWVQVNLLRLFLNFPLHNKGALPDKSDIVKITAVPWKIAMTRKNIISAFEKTGIYPFSKEKMMESIIGDVPKQSRPLGLSLLCDDAFQLSERQVRYLKQRDIDPVKVNSVRIGLECWLGILKPVAKEKKERTFVSGPALMTSDEMVEHIRTKDRSVAFS